MMINDENQKGNFNSGFFNKPKQNNHKKKEKCKLTVMVLPNLAAASS